MHRAQRMKAFTAERDPNGRHTCLNTLGALDVGSKTHIYSSECPPKRGKHLDNIHRTRSYISSIISIYIHNWVRYTTLPPGTQERHTKPCPLLRNMTCTTYIRIRMIYIKILRHENTRKQNDERHKCNMTSSMNIDVKRSFSLFFCSLQTGVETF